MQGKRSSSDLVVEVFRKLSHYRWNVCHRLNITTFILYISVTAGARNGFPSTEKEESFHFETAWWSEEFLAYLSLWVDMKKW